eukprot:CAMPEP_0184060962 /NCGR_PEP_ID=MMETSP0956-20121227/11145_1 /TAXON_ID=627963 /ORGANISM="Aplanochytrium sp, Strain PBS07" /LENGTH=396 /DNA_ID=CAMNT_0026357199 /DNA_START=266 /DNA_END=1454 /DNA_ORIENTATION=+
MPLGLRRASMIPSGMYRRENFENYFCNEENIQPSVNVTSLVPNSYPASEHFLYSENVQTRNSKPVLEAASTLDFSPFELTDDELQNLMVKMLVNSYPVTQCVNAPEMILQLVGKVRALYEGNSYHCFRHACDVTQAMYTLLQKRSIQKHLGPYDAFTLLLTCLVHDIGHTGNSNNVLRRSNDRMVELFGHVHDIGHTGNSNNVLRRSNDRMVELFGPTSTLEKYHISLARRLLEESPILLYLPSIERTILLNTLESLVLFTDMEFHSSFLDELEMHMAEFTSPSENPRFKLLLLGLMVKVCDISNVSHFVAWALVKVCDISNVSRPKQDAEAWSLRVADEMADLYKKSQELGLEPSLPQPQPSKEQRLSGTVHFARKFVKPLHELLEAICPQSAQE